MVSCKKTIQNLYRQQFIRFCLVGGMCTGIDAIIFYAVRIIASYPVALTSGYLISLVANYFLTVFWTFHSKPNTRNAIGVVAAHLFNLFVVRMGLMYVFVNMINISDCVAYIPTLIISVITNFLIIKYLVMKS